MNFALSPMELEALSLSLKVALWASFASLPLAIGAAWILARTRFWGHGLFNAALHLPLVVPPVVVGYVLLVSFSKHGIIGAWLLDVFGISFAFSWRGAAVAAAVMAFPLMVRAIRLSLEAVDMGLEQAAGTLGASKIKIFSTITLPLILPGIVTGLILAFARALGEFGATITFVSNIPGETQTLPLALYTLIQSPGGEAQAERLALLAVGVALAALMASEVMARLVRRKIGGTPDE